MLRIHNSLTGKKEELKPIRPGEIGMYVCGDTVYDFCHIGHARSKVAFDVVRRYLTWSGLRVRFVRNITDIDDKIIKRAAELGEPIETFTARFIAAIASGALDAILSAQRNVSASSSAAASSSSSASAFAALPMLGRILSVSRLPFMPGKRVTSSPTISPTGPAAASTTDWPAAWLCSATGAN